VRKKRGPGVGDAEARNDVSGGGNTPPVANRRHLVEIVVKHAVTVDLADGQPLPPFMEDGVVWCVVRRQHGRTLWRRITLQATNQSVAATLDGGLQRNQRRGE
jgi:hypothetical protein